MKYSSPLFSSSCITLLVFILTGCISNESENNEVEVVKSAVENEIAKALKDGLLDPWYPKAVDSVDGGFYSTFSNDFKVMDQQDKMIVTQSRHIWTNAKASKRYPEIKHFEKSAKHGFQFLKDKMWDKDNGGFYWLVDKQGNFLDSGDDKKTAYGNSFAIYALAAYFDAYQDSAALDLAQNAFNWLEDHSHDPIHRGYYQYMEMDGTPIMRREETPSSSVLGFKDQNSSIHLLEAFTELYTVWPDTLVKKRLTEMLYLVRDTMITENGNLILFFQPNWTPVSFRDSSNAFIQEHHYIDHVSFGHDVEIAYLMIEADHMLGLNDPKTLEIAKKVVDHALDKGWDSELGGFYDEGYYFQGDDEIAITHDTKNWWAQAEGLNTLLLMSKKFPNDRRLYYDLFLKQWKYIDAYLLDHEHGGWYIGGLDKQPDARNERKGFIWKGSYHNFRAMDNCLKMLSTEEH